VYDEPLRDLHAVHSLEHGAVWITYRPDLPEAEVEKLEALYSPGSYILVSPYEGEMDSPIVASAWGLQLGVDSADDHRLNSFLRAYERGPHTPEPGAACSGAVPLTEADSLEAWDALLGDVQTMAQSEQGPARPRGRAPDGPRRGPGRAAAPSYGPPSQPPRGQRRDLLLDQLAERRQRDGGGR